jgi:hypothetical protein
MFTESKSRRRFGYPLVVLLFCCFGCGSQPSDLPATFPVTGTVVDASGQPMTGGFVEFESKEDQNMLAVGDINADGNFVLTTYVNGVTAEGAVAGEHQVTVHPPQIEHGGPDPIRMRKAQNVEAKENEISLKLPRR